MGVPGYETVGEEEEDGWETVYDEFHRVKTETNKDGLTNEYTYNDEGYVASVSNSLTGVTSYEYDKNGNVTKTSDAMGNSTSYAYDKLGRVISETNALGQTWRTAYKPGNVVKHTAPNGETETVRYDNKNRIVSQTHATGSTWRTEYDDKNNLVRQTDAAGRTTQYKYDKLGNLKTTSQSAGGTYTYDYDFRGNVTKQADGMGNAVNWSYDKLGRATKETRKVNGVAETRSYQYEGGNLTKYTNGRGHTLSYGYDEDGRLTDDAGVIYEYDDRGNVTSKSKDGKAAVTSYDAMGRMEAYTDENGHTIRYSYDKLGNLETLTYPTGKNGEVLKVTYEYNEANQLEKVTDWQGRKTEYKYDANGRLKETKRPDGSVETIEYENGRVKKVTDKGKHGTISETTYAYDKNGNVTKENDTTYTYDDGGRVTKITTGDGKTYEYSYDQNGSLIDESDNGDGNRLSKYDNEQVKFDKDGNMTMGPLGGKSMEYQYNEFNQLVKAGETEYTYDVNGNRASMTDKNGKTTYVMDVNMELPRLLIKENSDGSRTLYVYGHGLISQETEDREGNRKDYRLFHYDYRGSTTALTDVDGNVTEKMRYSPYGELETRDYNTETIFLYVGREGIQTDDNGLLYMRARYYNSDVGRFINEDPIRDGDNWHAYCEGDPVNKIDPSGHEACFYKADDGNWRYLYDNKFLNFITGAGGYFPFLDTAFVKVIDLVSGSRTLTSKDKMTAVNNMGAVLGAASKTERLFKTGSKLAKYTKFIGKVSSGVYLFNLGVLATSNDSYINELTGTIYGSYIESNKWENTVAKFVQYKTLIKIAVDRKIITYTKSFGCVNNMK